ncbi:MAG TPA: hypothetical protein VF316_09595 [Polyangiaceae bacterium]
MNAAATFGLALLRLEEVGASWRGTAVRRRGRHGSPHRKQAALLGIVLEPVGTARTTSMWTGDVRAASLEEALDALPPDLRPAFDKNVRMMIERHREMFPELHLR